MIHRFTLAILIVVISSALISCSSRSSSDTIEANNPVEPVSSTSSENVQKLPDNDSSTSSTPVPDTSSSIIASSEKESRSLDKNDGAVLNESKAKDIVKQTLSRALACSWLSIGPFSIIEDAPEKDGFLPINYESQPPYFSVDVKQFQSTDDIKVFIQETFDQSTANQISSTIQERSLYRDIDGKLYVSAVGSGLPLTSYTWEPETISLVENTAQKIVAEMDTTCIGEPTKKQQLTLINEDGIWRCTDSYIENFTKK